MINTVPWPPQRVTPASGIWRLAPGLLPWLGDHLHGTWSGGHLGVAIGPAIRLPPEGEVPPHVRLPLPPPLVHWGMRR